MFSCFILANIFTRFEKLLDETRRNYFPGLIATVCAYPCMQISLMLVQYEREKYANESHSCWNNTVAGTAPADKKLPCKLKCWNCIVGILEMVQNTASNLELVQININENNKLIIHFELQDSLSKLNFYVPY